MSGYDKTMGRLRVWVSSEGARDYGAVECIDGWNESCKTLRNELSVEEMRDLHYMLGRAIAVNERNS